MASLCHHTSQVLPEPAFEGSEKRAEITFRLTGAAPQNGLRSLPRSTLDELMTLAHCCIVSSRSNEHFDAYVLSESSLFIYPDRWVLKTCGTTRLLDSIPRLLQEAAAIGAVAVRCKYSRASFLFPQDQPAPYTDFKDEVAHLDEYFKELAPEGGQPYVLGDNFHGLQWHVYIAGRAPVIEHPTFNLEICMTQLDEEAALQFFRTGLFVSSAQTTKDTGIADLLPNAAIDDYVFEPCGYSMNGIDQHRFITIHVTPEKSCSYASVEISGHMEELVDASKLLAQAVNIFKPGQISLAMSVDAAAAVGVETWGRLAKLPEGYHHSAAICQRLTCGGRVVYNTLSKPPKSHTPPSPTTVLNHASSFLSEITTASDNEEALVAPMVLNE